MACVPMNMGVKVNFHISEKNSKLLKFVDIFCGCVMNWEMFAVKFRTGNNFVIFPLVFQVKNEKKKRMYGNMNKLLGLDVIINWTSRV